MGIFDKLFGKRKEPSPRPTGGVTNYREGDTVKCGACGKLLRVKYHDPSRIAIATADALRGVALRCQSCGFIVCDPCSMPPGEMGMPICPSCKSQKNGPYFFIR